MPLYDLETCKRNINDISADLLKNPTSIPTNASRQLEYTSLNAKLRDSFDLDTVIELIKAQTTRALASDETEKDREARLIVLVSMANRLTPSHDIFAELAAKSVDITGFMSKEKISFLLNEFKDIHFSLYCIQKFPALIGFAGLNECLLRNPLFIPAYYDQASTGFEEFYKLFTTLYETCGKENSFPDMLNLVKQHDHKPREKDDDGRSFMLLLSIGCKIYGIEFLTTYLTQNNTLYEAYGTQSSITETILLTAINGFDNMDFVAFCLEKLPNITNNFQEKEIIDILKKEENSQERYQIKKDALLKSKTLQPIVQSVENSYEIRGIERKFEIDVDIKKDLSTKIPIKDILYQLINVAPKNEELIYLFKRNPELIPTSLQDESIENFKKLYSPLHSSRANIYELTSLIESQLSLNTSESQKRIDVLFLLASNPLEILQNMQAELPKQVYKNLVDLIIDNKYPDTKTRESASSILEKMLTSKNQKAVDMTKFFILLYQHPDLIPNSGSKEFNIFREFLVANAEWKKNEFEFLLSSPLKTEEWCSIYSCMSSWTDILYNENDAKKFLDKDKVLHILQFSPEDTIKKLMGNKPILRYIENNNPGPVTDKGTIFSILINGYHSSNAISKLKIFDESALKDVTVDLLKRLTASDSPASFKDAQHALISLKSYKFF